MKTTLAALEPGDRFRTFVDPNDPWVELRSATPREGELIDKSDAGATVRFGQPRVKRVEIRDQITGGVARAFDAIEVESTTRVSLGTPVVKL